jgi:hypothetical protein
MLKKIQQKDHHNLWNRLARNLIYDAKEVLLYCGINVPSKMQNGSCADYSEIIQLTTKGTNYGAIFDPNTHRIHFEPGYIQSIVDQANRFDFPIMDRAFGPGGIAAFIHTPKESSYDLENPDVNHILKQAMLAKDSEMPFSFVSARQLGQYEVEQFSVTSNIFDGPKFFTVATALGVQEAAEHINAGHYVITNHTIFNSPLTLSFKENIDVFIQCVQRQIPVMLTTQPFSGQNGPMTPYGIALLAMAEFLAGMAIAFGINPETKVVNGAYPTMCTPGKSPVLKIGSVVHNFTNYLVAFTSRLLDIASIQSGCTIEGQVHKNELLETDYQTVRAMVLWDDMFEGWHMVRHSYGFLTDLAYFSFQKAKDDIAALRHIQSLDEIGIIALLANSVRLNRDIQKAELIYQNPTIIFNREKDTLLGVIIEAIDNFNGDFGSHDHTLKNIPIEWF